MSTATASSFWLNSLETTTGGNFGMRSTRRAPSPAPHVRSELKRSRSPHDSDSSATRARSKRRLIDSFTRLSLGTQLEPMNVADKQDHRGEIPPPSRQEAPILRYNYWDRNRPADEVEENERMDTSNAHTIFISSLDSSSSDEDDTDGQDRIVFVPDVERKIMDLPYALLRRRQDEYPAVPAALPLKEPESALVLYKPKEQVIAESIAQHAERPGRQKWEQLDSGRMADEENWGDDELEPDNDAADEDVMDMD